MEGIKLKQEDFFTRIENDALGEGSNVKYVIDFPIVFELDDITWQFRKINSVIFKEKVAFRNVEINSGVQFQNCKFEKGIVFDKVRSINFDFNQNRENSSICFKSCEANFVSLENWCNLDRKFSFIDNCKIQKIIVNELRINNEGLKIRNSEIGNLDISKSIFDINISNSKFVEPFRVEGLNGNVTLFSNEFYNWVSFWNLQVLNSFILNKNLFKESFNIEGSRIRSMSIIGDVFEKKAKLENRDLTTNNLESSLDKLYVSEVKCSEGFYFLGLSQKINELKIPLTPESSGLLKFEAWDVDNAILTGVNQNLKLLFSRINFKFFMINDFTNYSDISFHKCKGFGECTLNLTNADLGSTKFNEFEFNTFKEIRADNVILDKINPTSCNWFDDTVLTIIDDTQSKEIKLKRKREVYRQLKQALKNNGNQIDSLSFQSREFSAYREQLKIANGKSRGDKIIMWVSQSNDFGLNWVKPVWIVFFVTLLFYLVLLPVISNEIEYGISLTDWSTIWSAFTSSSKSFWLLFNPIRKIDDVYGQNVTGLIYCLDLLHKIFLGVMIFQIIKAFRKYVSS